MVRNRIVTALVLIGLGGLGGAGLVWGGTAMLIGLAILAGIGLALGIFTAGMWYAYKSIQMGSQLSQQAQQTNDQSDLLKVKVYGEFAQQLLKLQLQNGPRPPDRPAYPPLLNGGSGEDDDDSPPGGERPPPFPIRGLD